MTGLLDALAIAAVAAAAVYAWGRLAPRTWRSCEGAFGKNRGSVAAQARGCEACRGCGGKGGAG